MREESELDAQIWSRIGLFWEKTVFHDHFDVTKCLQQIEMSDFLWAII